MPVSGGAAIVVTSLDRARRLARRPVVVTGFGEHLTHKTPTYAPSLDVTPIRQAVGATESPFSSTMGDAARRAASPPSRGSTMCGTNSSASNVHNA